MTKKKKKEENLPPLVTKTKWVSSSLEDLPAHGAQSNSALVCGIHNL